MRIRTVRPLASEFSVRAEDGRLVIQIVENCDELLTEIEGDLAVAVGNLRARADAVVTARLQGGKWWDALSAGDWKSLADQFVEVFKHLEYDTRPSVHEDDPLPFELSLLIPMLELMAYGDGAGGAATWVAPLIFRLENLLADRRLALITENCDEISSIEDWLNAFLGPAGNGQITVIDLSLVPVKALHLVVGVLGRLIFEAHERFRRANGRPLPTVLVAEEAHLFLGRRVPRAVDDGPEPAAELCRDSFDRIAREGRKFGLSMVVASQRPSELSETVLSQCSNFLVHRVVNEADQDLVRRLVPDSLGGLLREVPSLPAGAGILMGTAPVIPTLVELHQLPPEYRPNSFTPSFFGAWHDPEQQNPGWGTVSAGWAVHAVTDTDEEPF